MTLLLVLRAMTQKGDGALFGQALEQTQSEFLTVILDGFIPLIHWRSFEQFFAITFSKFVPQDFACQEFS